MLTIYENVSLQFWLLWRGTYYCYNDSHNRPTHKVA